jgi:hypothetical protein
MAELPPQFHITSRGEVDNCEARLIPCPLGGQHYDTLKKQVEQRLRERNNTLNCNQERQVGTRQFISVSDRLRQQGVKSILRTERPQEQFLLTMQDGRKFLLELVELPRTYKDNMSKGVVASPEFTAEFGQFSRSWTMQPKMRFVDRLHQQLLNAHFFSAPVRTPQPA